MREHQITTVLTGERDTAGFQEGLSPGEKMRFILEEADDTCRALLRWLLVKVTAFKQTFTHASLTLNRAQLENHFKTLIRQASINLQRKTKALVELVTSSTPAAPDNAVIFGTASQTAAQNTSQCDHVNWAAKTRECHGCGREDKSYYQCIDPDKEKNRNETFTCLTRQISKESKTSSSLSAKT